MEERRVVITGRGVVSPLGIGLERHRERLIAGRPVIRGSTKLSEVGFSLDSAGELPAEELESSLIAIAPKQRKLMNRAGILAAIASSLAAREAGLEQAAVDSSRLGVFLATWFTFYDLSSFVRQLSGTEVPGEPYVMDSEKANLRCLEAMNPLDSLKVLPNLTAGHVAILHKAQGCTRVIADGWRGGLLAVAEAIQAIRDGELDVVLAGGAESPLEEGIYCDLSVLEVLAEKNNGRDPDRLCRPFDAGRCGMVLGEGAGMVVLEERSHALGRGVQIIGEVAGTANAAPSSDGDAKEVLEICMQKALRESRLSPEGLDFFHANGDSTQNHDRAEWQAIQEILGPSAGTVPVTATKSLHGHLLSASGAVELISSLIMLEEGVIAPIANCDGPDDGCRLDLVRGAARRKAPMKSALLNGLGLFGEGISLVVRR